MLEGLNYLHHPLRADAAKKYVQLSLEMLWEIQKTGDIFFPGTGWRRRWAGMDEGVAKKVRDFLKNLRRTIRNAFATSHCNQDELYRAADITKK